MQGQCLYSPFSSFFPHPPGELVGSKGLTHQQLPFSSFLTFLAFSSSFNIPFISTSLIVLLFSVFFLLLPFHFSFCSMTSALSLPETLILFPFPFSLSHHIPYSHCPSLFSHTSLLYPPSPVSFNFIQSNFTYTYCTFFHPSVCLSWLPSSLVFSEEYLKSGRGRAEEEKSSEETRLPRARGTAYPYQASTCLLDPPGHTALFT